MAEFVGKPDFVILTGVVRGVHPNANGNESGTLTVNRVFQGVVPRHELPVLGGGGGDCTIPLDEGMQFVGVATIDRGAVAPALCLPFGDLRDGSGQQILADIQRLLPGAPPIETGTGDVAASAVIAIVGLAIGVSVIGGTILVARRRGSAA